MRHLLSVVFGAAFTAAVSWSIGRVLFARLRITLQKLEHELLAGVTGAAVLSFLVFVLCAMGMARVPVFWAVGLVAPALNWKFGAWTAEGQTDPLPRNWRWLCGLPFVFYALLYLSNSLAPEKSPDGQAYHLALVYRYFRLHGFERLTTNMYGNLSQGMEMLFLFAFSFGRHAAAATFHACFLFGLPVMMFCYGRRIGKSFAGACAGMIVYLSPLVGIDGVSAYNDVALATACFATFYLVEIWRDRKTRALLVPIGLVAGFCFAIKYTGFIAAVYVVAIVGWELIRSKRTSNRALISLATVVCMIALMVAPWLLKNWLWLGNPVSPFFTRVFPNPFTHITFEDYYRQYLSSYGIANLKPWFWMVTVKGQLEGLVGPVFLLTPLGLLSLRLRAGRRILLAGLFFLIPYPQNIGARFLIPVLPFAALGIALALEFLRHSRWVQAVVILLAAVLAWPKVIDQYRSPRGGWQISKMPWKAALGIIPQDEWLLKNSDGWVTARMLDEFVPEGKKVWSTSPIAESYSKTEILVNYYSAEGELIQDILNTATKPIYQPLWTLRYTFSPRTKQRVRLVQSAESAGDIWSIGEMQFFLGSQEIRPGPKWKFGASSFPWDIGLAFDRNPVTRWRSWEPIHPGMYVDVDFGEPVQLDRIELQASPDQWKIDVALEGIPARLEKLEAEPSGDLRRLATATVKARGIDYLLISGDHWLTADMHGDPGRWGLTKVADRGTDWLFKIQ